MAVITEINGVSTSGTTGVNNIFGSGTGGGSSSPSTAPTIFVGNSSTFGGNNLIVSNSLVYTQPLFNLIVTDPDGNEIVSNAQDWTTTVNNGFYLLEWRDASNATGTFTIHLSVVDADASPEEIESSVTTATYTKLSAQFKYIRVYGVNSSGDRGLNHNQNSMVSDIQLFTGTELTGTQMTGVGNGTYNTSPTSNPDYTISTPKHFNSYDEWKAFDNSTDIGSSWWSLSRNSGHGENYIELRYNNQTENASSAYATDADIPLTKSIRLFTRTNGNCDGFEVYGSLTGAFAGEETQFGGRLDNNVNDYRSVTL